MSATARVVPIHSLPIPFRLRIAASLLESGLIQVASVILERVELERRNQIDASGQIRAVLPALRGGLN